VLVRTDFLAGKKQVSPVPARRSPLITEQLGAFVEAIGGHVNHTFHTEPYLQTYRPVFFIN
jgi:hypothetical protein